MNYSEKSRYVRIFQQVTHKGGESEMNHIKRFKNAQASSVSVENTYSVNQLMHKFLDKFHQGGKHYDQIAIQEV